MTLVASVSIPIVLISIVMEARLVEQSNIKEKFAMENATKMAVEAISNIRTVASLGQEPHVLKRYMVEIDNTDEYCQKKSRFRGFVFGLGQTVPLMGYGLSLWYGGTLVAKKEMPYENVIKVGEALIFGSWVSFSFYLINYMSLMKLFESRCWVKLWLTHQTSTLLLCRLQES